MSKKKDTVNEDFIVLVEVLPLDGRRLVLGSEIKLDAGRGAELAKHGLIEAKAASDPDREDTD